MANEDPTRLVSVAAAPNSFEAGLLRGLLEDAGIPCMVRPSGVDGSQLGFGLLTEHGGPQQVLVHAARLEEARALLAEALAADEDDWAETANAQHLEDALPGRGPRNYGLIGAYARIYFWSLLAMGVIAGIYFLSRAL